MRKLILAAVATSVVASVAIASPSFAAYTGPSSWATAGLKSVVVETGPYSWSIDGLGTTDGAGDIQVSKPTGATVYKAYFVAAQVAEGEITVGVDSDVLLNGSAVNFDYESLDASPGNNGFNNYFADVTTLVQSTIDGHAAGTFNISVDEGALNIEGTELVVIFEDPAVDVATIVLAFGNSSTTGDSFTLAFDALTAPQTADLQLSLGISYSYDDDGLTRPSWQSSSVTVNGELLTDIAGSFDDSEDPDHADGSLLTVGGVGDSTTNPTIPSNDLWSQAADDELYSLSPFVSVGSTSINVQTSNPSSDDNIFLDVFYLNHIAATVTDPKLASTGTEASPLGLFGAAVVAAGAAAFVAARRRKKA